MMRRNVDTYIFKIHFNCIFYSKYTLLYHPTHYILFRDYSVLNYGQLLFLLGNEGLKINIWNIEKINKRIVHLKSSIHFNEISIQEGLQPNFTNIYIYIYGYIANWPDLRTQCFHLLDLGTCENKRTFCV